VNRGAELRSGLEAIASHLGFVREVRGLGLMIGMEVQDGAGSPAPLLRDRIIEEAFRKGLLLLPCGTSTVRFCPPLCLTRRHVRIGLEILDAAMAASLAGLGLRLERSSVDERPDETPAPALA